MHDIPSPFRLLVEQKSALYVYSSRGRGAARRILLDPRSVVETDIPLATIPAPFLALCGRLGFDPQAAAWHALAGFVSAAEATGAEGKPLELAASLTGLSAECLSAAFTVRPAAE